ncbi:MAG: sigma-70 family RNA polymerase sigma factor [Pyrinomonadaceae bacterium]|nr:sigma-70 family RNA polymerase sigma factor [Pyrinomonadaceae bacterium]
MSESEIARSFFPVAKPGREPAETNGSHLSAPALLAVRMKDGEDAAFEEFYRQFSALVNGVVLARVPYSDAEDVVQEVFIAAFRSIASLRDPDRMAPWIATIARNRSVEYHRRKKPSEELKESIEGKRGHSNEALEALEAIRSLPDSYRESLTLRLVEGLTGPEIAELTGKTEASVRVNLHRGMKKLRAKLGLGSEAKK